MNLGQLHWQLEPWIKGLLLYKKDAKNSCHSTKSNGFRYFVLLLGSIISGSSPALPPSGLCSSWRPLGVPFQGSTGDTILRLPVSMPNHFHFLLLMVSSIRLCRVLFHSSSFEMTSGHRMFRIFHKHFLIKIFNFLVGTTFRRSPCFRAVQKDGLHFRIENPDLCSQSDRL